MKQERDGADQRPNILFVFPDQLGAAWTSTYGNPDVHTPNLDAFAAEGVLFRQAYTNTPLCAPYRGALFTGRYPHQTGVTCNGRRIPHCETTLAELFNQGGYYTSYVGKWHLSGPPHGNRWIPPMERAGFQSFVGWESHHVDHWKGFVFEEEDTPIALSGHETDGLTELVCDRLADLSGRKEPFCLFAAYQAPHHPCSPPEQYASLYRGKVYADQDQLTQSAVFCNHYDNGELGRDISLEEYRETYFGEITQMDAAFGRILRKLKELGLDRNTVVIFTSDHGDMAGRHGLFEKSVMYEEAVRVPLVIRAPDSSGNAICDSFFSTVDFLPTMLELCGLPPHESAEGRSHARAIRGEAQALESEAVYISHYESGQPGHCIRSGALKLTTDLLATRTHSLYDLDVDPYEMHNLLEQPGHEKIAHQLQEQIRQWYQDTAHRAGDPDEAAEMSPWFKERIPEK